MGAARALSELASSFHGVDVLVLCYHQIRSRERFHSQMKALAEHGYSILSMEQFTEWLRGSKLILEEIMGRPVNAFCYPYGAYDARARKVVQEAGFDVAFTVDLGGVRRGDDPYLLKRVPVLGEPSVGEFTAYLSGTLGVSGSILLYWKLRERLLDRGWLTSQKAHSV